MLYFKEIEKDEQCKCNRKLSAVHAGGNAGVLVNDLIQAYNLGPGSFPGAFQGCYGKNPNKRSAYYERLFNKIIYEALRSVYSNGNALAGMPEKDVKCAVKLFWEQLVK